MTDEPVRPEPPPLRGKMIRGTLLMVSMRWITRLMGLVNTAILARLLAPSDFGVVAMCMLVVGLLEVLCELNVGTVLIQRTDATTDEWNSAWTLRIGQGCVVGLVILAARPFAAAYFGDPRVGDVLPLLSVSVLLQSLENIGVVAFRRDLDFRKDFIFSLARKVITVVVTILLAVLVRNYWALVLGIVIGNGLGTVLSYFVHPYRPRICFRATRRLWDVSRWFIATNIAYYFLEKTDELVVGGGANTRALGTYTVSSEVSELPTSEVVLPMMRALFPGFAKLQHEPARLEASYLAVLGVTATFACSVGFGLSLLAPYIVPILLGQKWLDAVPLIRILAIGGAIRMIYHNTGSLLIAVGRVRTVALIALLQSALVAPVLWFAIRQGGVLGMTYTKVSLTCVFVVVWFATVHRALGIRLGAMAGRLYRPAIAGLCMYGVTMAVQPWIPSSPLPGMILTIAVGGLTYSGVLLGAWKLAKSPPGAETFLLEILRSRVLPILRRFRRAS